MSEPCWCPGCPGCIDCRPVVDGTPRDFDDVRAANLVLDTSGEACSVCSRIERVRVQVSCGVESMWLCRECVFEACKVLGLVRPVDPA